MVNNYYKKKFNANFVVKTPDNKLVHYEEAFYSFNERKAFAHLGIKYRNTGVITKCNLKVVEEQLTLF